jgi:dTDP-4-dehydrorhamnose 3,5-epimerase
MDKNIIEGIEEFFIDSFVDNRGEIYTFWNKNDCKLKVDFNHDKFTLSHKNVLRGLHGDFESTKYVTCVQGEVFYVFVDFRENSKTYMQWDSVILSQEKKNAILFPAGIASGALTLSDVSVTAYKLYYPNDYPDVNQQFSIKWDSLDVEWPCKNIILSERDR